jgi:hypothetical protein
MYIVDTTMLQVSGYLLSFKEFFLYFGGQLIFILG